MNDQLHQRKAPVHLPNFERHNKPIIVFLTVCTSGRKRILANQNMHDLLVGCWNDSTQWRVGAYIIMPDHIHLFCSPCSRESEGIAKWVTYWKRAVSRERSDLKPIWQRSCWDTQLRAVDSYSEKWKYVELNPVRQSLVSEADEWPYKGVLNELRW